jgi:hypothetical protein
MTRLIGFGWNEVAAMIVDVSACESTSIYPLNLKRVLEDLFSTSDNSETVTFMETAPPDMAPICAPSTSGTISQYVLPISARTSLNILKNRRHRPVPKIPSKYSI